MCLALKIRKIRRIVHLWRRVLPPWFQWLLLRLQSRLLCWETGRWEREAQQFYERTAPELFATIVLMGGYFIKLGQRFSSTRGFIAEPYVAALKPLCADVPPRDFEIMASVFLAATGQSVTEAFETIDAHSLGSASLAQTHRATLRPKNTLEKTREAVVKIQYPEVNETFQLDLDNVLIMSKLMAPECFYDGFRREYATHLDELDFRKEAKSLIRVGRSMNRAGFSPQKVVIPQPMLALTTQKTLVMEYLPGLSFQSIIRRNVDAFARSLGLRDAAELHERFNEQTHVQQIGNRTTEGGKPPMTLDANAIARAKLASNIVTSLTNSVIAVRNSSVLALRGAGLRSPLQLRAYKKPPTQELQRIFDLVVAVHGHQLLIDGYVNIDPHPGNILVMPDGRVGLIDYGQCVTFTKEERRGLARVLRALRSGDKLKTAAAMRALPPCGYQVKNDCWQAVFAYAQGFLDKIDGTPIPYDDGSLPSSDITERVSYHTELVVPRCVSFARRLTLILLSISVDFGVQTSLAESWENLVEQELSMETDDQTDKVFTRGYDYNASRSELVHVEFLENPSLRTWRNCC